MVHRKTAAGLPLGLLAAAGFLSSAGARVIDPLLDVIARDFGTSIPMVAVLITAFTVPYGLNQLLLGPVGDKFGKLRVMLGALIGYAASTAACSLASDLDTLTILRACAGASSAGLIPVCLAYIADAVPYQERQVVLSRFLLGVVAALTMSGPIGGLFGQYIGWRGVFALLSTCSLVVAALLAWRIRGLPDRRSPNATFRLDLYKVMFLHPLSVLLLLGTMADGMLMAGSFPFIAPFLHDSFALSYAGVGLILASFGIGAFVYTRFVYPMLRQFGEAGLMSLGGVLMASGLVIGMVSDGWPVFVLVESMLGLGFFMFHTVLQARATEMLPHARATAVSSFAAMLFLGQGIGAEVMGRLIGAVGFRNAFLMDAAAILLLTIFLRLSLVSDRVSG